VTAPLLVVINGPIGVGKTTVSIALAGLLEGQGRRAAAIDIDELWAMVDHQKPRKGGVLQWSLSRRGAAVLADEFFADGVDVVIVNGPFYQREERDQLLERLRTRVDVRYVTLTVPFEEALRRTQADPDSRRDASREREWLGKHHERAAMSFPPLRETDLIVDTSALTREDVAAAIVRSLPR
jgi:chloramphenicol 3-O-phosphotransferase